MRLKSLNLKYMARGLSLLALIGGVAVIAVVPGALANAGDPDSTHATWQYASGTSGPVNVTVTGTWSWGDNSLKDGGKDSQSCGTGKTVSSTFISGHEAVGIAVSWNDSSTPNTLTGKATDGSAVTLHLGNTMDWTNSNYCAGTTAAAPYPSGSFSASHQYPSYAAFIAATNNGQMCANAYDVHKVGDAKENNPAQNGDNTLRNGHYSRTVDCSVAQSTNPPPPTGPPTTTPPPTTPPPTTPPASPGISLLKLERVGAKGTFTTGPVNASIGDTIFYQMFPKNTGNTTLHVTLSDPRCDSGTLAPAGPVDIAPGGVVRFTCSHLLKAGDGPVFVNAATASAPGVSASAGVSASPGVSATASVPAKITAGGVLGATKRLHPAKHVVARAKPASPVVKSASFTG